MISTLYSTLYPFQSPIHRVSNLEPSDTGLYPPEVRRFQSPIHRVSNLEGIEGNTRWTLHPVSIPYSSGLKFRGAMAGCWPYGTWTVSIPYSSGLKFRGGLRGWPDRGQLHVSIPYSSGLKFRAQLSALADAAWAGFNPLFIGSQI